MSNACEAPNGTSMWRRWRLPKVSGSRLSVMRRTRRTCENAVTVATTRMISMITTSHPRTRPNRIAHIATAKPEAMAHARTLRLMKKKERTDEG